MAKVGGDRRIRRGRDARCKVDVVAGSAVFSWAVGGFEYNPHQKSRMLIARNRETDSIAIALYGKAGTLGGVAKIGPFTKIFIAGLRRVVARSSTMAAPSAAQRHPRGIQPAPL